MVDVEIVQYRCEDYPACGHYGEEGPCPVIDANGDYHMRCTCGAILPVGARYSICEGCMERHQRLDDEEAGYYYQEEDEYED